MYTRLYNRATETSITNLDCRFFVARITRTRPETGALQTTSPAAVQTRCVFEHSFCFTINIQIGTSIFEDFGEIFLWSCFQLYSRVFNHHWTKSSSPFGCFTAPKSVSEVIQLNNNSRHNIWNEDSLCVHRHRDNLPYYLVPFCFISGVLSRPSPPLIRAFS